MRLGAQQESARAVLRRTLDASNRTLVRSLLYQPQDKHPVLNIEVLSIKVHDPLTGRDRYVPAD